MGAEKHKMRLEHFVVPESKKMLRKGQGTSKGQKSEVEDAPNGQNQSNLSSKINDDMIKYP